MALDKEGYASHVGSDSGASLLAYLKANNLGKSFSPMLQKDGSIKLQMVRTWNNWEEVSKRNKYFNETSSPGPFMGEIYSFNRRVGRPPVSGGELNINNYLDRVGGIQVLRDGFRVIEGKNDWLRLGDAWTSGKSWYGLKPKNTIGYVYLTVNDNGSLSEKSDREGFLENPSRRGFDTVCELLKIMLGEITDKIGRGYNGFIKKFSENQSEDTPQTLGEHIHRHTKALRDARTHNELAIIAASAASDSIATIEVKISELPLDEIIKAPIIDVQRNAARRLIEVEREIHAVSGGLGLESERTIAWIKNKTEELFTKVKELNDMIGLGLAASGLVHEVDPFVKSIVDRTKLIEEKAKMIIPSEINFVLWSETIRSYANTINKKMAFLNPMLRTNRERKATFDLVTTIRDYFDERKRTVLKNTIQYICVKESSENSLININSGKFFQVIDNLTRNSEHWLTATKTKDPTVKVTVHGHKIHFEDNGPGVDPQYEHSLFELFESARPDGHGIGLYLAEEILHDNEGTIILSPERNRGGRRYKFLVTFSSEGKK